MTNTWLITGTSSGFGRELVEQLLTSGARVAATARNVTTLDDLKKKHQDRLQVYNLDVTKTLQIRQVVNQAFDFFGKIDVIVSNAGYGLLGGIEEVTDEQIQQQFDTNVIGSVQLARAVLPYLRAQKGGRFIQLSSMGGQISFPAFGLYHATKWAIEGFCDTLAKEVASFDIGVTLIEPGGAHTSFSSSSLDVAEDMPEYANTMVYDVKQNVLANAFPKPGSPEKIAAAIISSAQQNPAPLRVALGSDAYTLIHDALSERLSALEEQKDISLSADVSADAA